MASREESAVRELVKHAIRDTRVPTSSTRREALQRLIDLTHAQDASAKIFAAANIRHFFADFPELETDAINAIYDLCEDPSSKVRLEGYGAIVDTSRSNHKCIGQNADVLLQLLQTENQQEAQVVKKALQEHLDMDPQATLSVLCYQISPPDEPMETTEDNTRDRLRSLVLSFLSVEAKIALVERHALPGSEGEKILFEALLSAIPRLDSSEATLVVQDLIVSLPSFNSSGSGRAAQTLSVILRKAELTLRKDLENEPVTLDQTRPYLRLAAIVVIDKNASAASELLRFYHLHLSTKGILQKLRADDLARVFWRRSETVAAFDRQLSTQSTHVINPVRSMVPGQSAVFFECFDIERLNAMTEESRKRLKRGLELLFTACKEQPLPPQFHASLQTLMSNLSTTFGDEFDQIRELARLLVSPAPPAPKIQRAQTSVPLTAPNPVSVIRNRPSTSRIQIEPSSKPHTSLPVTEKRQRPFEDDASRRGKKAKGNIDGPVTGTSSLLSRLSSSTSSPIARPSSAPPRTPNMVTRTHPVGPIVVEQPKPEMSLSIKGAAKRKNESSLQTRISDDRSAANSSAQNRRPPLHGRGLS